MSVVLTTGYLGVTKCHRDNSDIVHCKIVLVGESPFAQFGYNVNRYSVDDIVLVNEFNLSELAVGDIKMYIIKEKHICGKIV